MNRRKFLTQMGAATGTAALHATSPSAMANTTKPKTTTIALLGDILLLRKISQVKDPDFLALVELLRGADMTWGNCELPILDPRTVYPVNKQIDPHVCGEPWVAEELAWLGIDAVGFANNHTLDFGSSGMVQTFENLDRVGINHAGAGENLGHASRPGYVDTRSGRLAHVNMASTFLPNFAASDGNDQMAGRPGLNPVRVNRVFSVGKKLFKQLREFQEFALLEQGYGAFMDLIESMIGDKVMFGDAVIEEGDGFGLSETANPADQERIVKHLGAAANMAHQTIATIHCHEAFKELNRPSLFMQDFAKACLDGGADMFVGHGPHVLRGIEMVDGKPIFYSIGNFVFQYESMTYIPAESWISLGKDKDSVDSSEYFDIIPYPKDPAYWRSVVPYLTYRDGELAKVKLFPIEMGFGLDIFERGTPRLVKGDLGGEIIESLAELSKPYGTDIVYEDGVGRIKL